MMKKINSSSRILIAVALLIFSGLLFSSHNEWADNSVMGWFANMGIIVFMLITISKGLGLPNGGFLIDKTRRRYSLSRLQLVAWTVIILSAYISQNFTVFWSYFFENKCCDQLPQLSEIPVNVLGLLGISTGTALVTPVINQAKSSITNRSDARRMTSGNEEFATYEEVLYNNTTYENLVDLSFSSKKGKTEKVKKGSNIGAVYRNINIEDAELVDIFRGEEVKDFDLVDISKVQNFLFTILTMTIYAFQIFLALRNESNTLPDLNNTFLLIIGISHSYYVINKAIVQSTPAKKKLERAIFIDGTI
ncbi:hypothetical protein [Roseivirga sp. E12]|uniref:hypothetical protein n=1 Tax=Roseivirga sp. E12 TaxID=2819237 RepID=UPI001ABC52D7|nr:hypothetical protein [Roseivirga sp. E12]MBO3697353.1 hypothetical protein [Roseivirga sp. E12]